jgi:hypothetical protein
MDRGLSLGVVDGIHVPGGLLLLSHVSMGHGLKRGVAEAESGVVRVNIFILHLDYILVSVAHADAGRACVV